MFKSASARYVGWFHERTHKWATWEPGDRVEPGTIGRFDRRLRFRHAYTLQNLEIPFQLTPEDPVRDRLYASLDGIELAPNVSAKGVEPTTLTGGKGSVGFLTTRRHSHMLQIRDATSSRISGIPETLMRVRQAVADGAWILDWVLVVERVRASKGFAILCSKKGLNIELAVEAGLAPMPTIEAYGGSVGLTFQGVSGDLASYDFAGGSPATPFFSEIIRVRQSLWRKLTGGEPKVVDPTGREIDSRGLTTLGNLSHLPVGDRVFSPRSSELSYEEVLAMPLSSLFEELDHSAVLPVDDSLEPPEAHLQALQEELHQALASRRVLA